MIAPSAPGISVARSSSTVAPGATPGRFAISALRISPNRNVVVTSVVGEAAKSVPNVELRSRTEASPPTLKNDPM